jgi:hypothetical protein
VKKRINVNLYPREGYFFKESDGAIIRSDSWPKVMAKVQAYRKSAGYSIGDVESEVAQQACARNPAHCATINDATERQTLITSLKTRILKYMSFLRGLGPRIPWVDAAAAARRASICASCPHNTPLPEGCGSCRAALKALRDEVLGRGRAQDRRVNGCAILGEDLPTSVHVDHDVVENDQLPDFCWRKRRPPV